MNKLRFYISGIFIVLIFSCTKDLIVQNIKDKTVVVISPANNTKTPDNAITFWWETIDGAEKYTIQIVKPSFASAQTLITDTNVTGNKFTLNLTPASYQWRIRATNAGGSTSWFIYNLTIDTTSDLSHQLVVPISPLSGFETRNRTITFNWNTITAATHYNIQIMNSAVILKDTSTANSSYTYSISTAVGGSYSWHVKALNNNSLSQWNTAQTFTIDLQAPNPPVLISPATLSTITNSATLKWSRNVATINDTKYDSVYIATDSTFQNIYIINTARVNGTQTSLGVFTPTIPASPTFNSYYFWRVKSVDSLGNASAPSNWFKFHLN